MTSISNETKSVQTPSICTRKVVGEIVKTKTQDVIPTYGFFPSITN